MLGFIISFCLSLFLTPAVIKWYQRNNWIDHPETNLHAKTTHTQAVPRGGGVPILLSSLLAAYLLLEIDVHLLAIFLGAVVLAITGVIDDLKDLDPKLRLGIGFLAALLVVGSGIGIAYVSNPLGSGVIPLDQPRIFYEFLGQQRQIWIVADLFALLFIVWNMNSVNWAKGVDGQLPGFVASALLFIGFLSGKFLGDPTAFSTQQLAFIVSGSYAGLLIWNWYPQKIMPGYGAGSLAGYFLAVLSILSGAKLATLLMVLAIPTTDAVFSVARRVAAGKSPFWGDRGHLHHKLLDVLKWSKPKIALFYTGCSLLLGYISLHLNSLGKLIALLVASGITVGFLVWAKVYSLRE